MALSGKKRRTEKTRLIKTRVVHGKGTKHLKHFLVSHYLFFLANITSRVGKYKAGYRTLSVFNEISVID
jgi:hypothetical protein